MKFSLILATLGRAAEPARFLESLKEQSHSDFEVIIVDQNADDRIMAIYKRENNTLPLRYIRSEAGVSKARNAGLKAATGDIIAFPDDDCTYPRDVLHAAAEWLSGHKGYGLLCGSLTQEDGSATVGRWGAKESEITRANAFRYGAALTLFLRKEVVRSIGGMDETLGPGAGTDWGACEDTEYLLQALAAGHKAFYCPRIRIHHPDKTARYGLTAYRRAYSYGMGFGHVARRYGYPAWFIIYNVARPIAGAITSFLTFRPAKAVFHILLSYGRARGWAGTK